MKQKINQIFDFVNNVGLRYLMFRIIYAIKAKIGWQKKTFPTQPKPIKCIGLKEWKQNLPIFFFYGKNIQGLSKQPTKELEKTFDEIQNGVYTFFNKSKIELGKKSDWLVNPSTGYKYDINSHWSDIQDLSAKAGDIKYVWEKARFSYLYDIIRYDYHFEKDQSEFVLEEIEDFIDKNPLNQGPNYKCSQEISLRVLNWTYALYYYKDSENLTEPLFGKIMNAIYWQIHHVYHNIHFSRIAVRNNHALTETLMLYLSDKLFPFFPDVQLWSKKGKKWFEKEIEYQIYEDGTFLQFSMNYHRVAVQLLTWGIQLSKLHNDTFGEIVINRAKKSLEFLDASMDPVSGELPNYGSNDGALFFKLTNDDYRNYSSQLDDLRAVLYSETFNKSESISWYGLTNVIKKDYKYPKSITEFENGGYYIIQDERVKTFIRCGVYKDRPFQSDNLHLDIWVDGVNYFRDTGSYKYNTESQYINYFNGCEGHNTVSVDGQDQMLKGNRFIWLYWVKKAKATLIEKKNQFKFNGEILAFKNVGNNIKHQRIVEKTKDQNNWEVKDTISNKGGLTMYQYWHLHPDYYNNVEIITKDANETVLEPLIEEKWFSGYYGIKEKSIRLTFATSTDIFNTTIKIHHK